MAGWIKAAVSANPGGLHRSLGVPADKIIPQSKIMKATHANNPRIQKQARLAETLEHLHRCYGGKV